MDHSDCKEGLNMNRVIRSVCAIMEEETGKGQALRIRERAQKRYEALCTENAGDSRALRAHTYSRIYPCIALYQAMIDDGIDPKKADGYIGEYFQRIARVMEPHVQRMARLPGMASRMPKFFMKIAEKMFGTNAGFVYEFPQSHGNEARFNMVRCPYHEACRRYGCEELTHVFCDGDDAGYGNMHPRLYWGRTKTLGRGDDCCDFLIRYR